MTAILTRTGPSDDIVTVSSRAAWTQGLLNLRSDRLRLDELIKGVLMFPAMMGALLAEHIAGSVSRFAEMMQSEPSS